MWAIVHHFKKNHPALYVIDVYHIAKKF